MKTKISYEEATRILTSREKFYICLGLDRIAKVLNLMGNPQEKLRIIHIAGTNGKGSVSKMLSEILSYSGYKTGLYTSPHIIDYTERIQINGIPVSKDDFSELIPDICRLAENNDIYLTEFEVLTAAMFKYFEQQKTDICVIETGLGGRLDATNIISSNILSVITSISLDHTDRLGNTIEEIAAEKAGIIKPECPVVISASNRGYNTVISRAKSINATVLTADDAVIEFINNNNYARVNGKNYRFNLLGLWQKQNLGLVATVINYLIDAGYNISEFAFSEALKNVVWNCRFQYLQEENIVIDGTHNPDGAALLRQSLDFYFPNSRRIWIYGSMKNKDYANIMNTLFRDDDIIYFCEFGHSGSATADDLKKKINKKSEIIKIDEIDNFISKKEDTSLTLISGSFYMIGEILNLNPKLKNIARLDNT